MIDENKGYYKFYLIIEGYSNYRLYCERETKLPKGSLMDKLNSYEDTIEKHKNESWDALREWFEKEFVPKTMDEFGLKVMENNVVHLNPKLVSEFCGLTI